MIQPGRKYSATSSYRYGFNGKENDNDVKGEGNQQDYGMRIYDPRLGRFLSVDPLRKDYPWYTPYQFAGNMPIAALDLDGAELWLNLLPNPFSKKNTAKIKSNLGVKEDSKASKAIDFIAGAGDRYRDLNNPATYIAGVGDHVKNMHNNLDRTLNAPNVEEAVNSAFHLMVPSLNSAEQTGYQAGKAIQTGDFRTLGSLCTDAAAFVAEYGTAGGTNFLKSPRFKVDLMGGPKTNRAKFINYDLDALEGIKADVKDFSKFFAKNAVDEIVVNNPRAQFLQHVSESLESGGTITIRGQMANPYFSEIWNAKTHTSFEIIGRKTGLSIEGYFQTSGEPLRGASNSLNEIVLKKK